MLHSTFAFCIILLGLASGCGGDAPGTGPGGNGGNTGMRDQPLAISPCINRTTGERDNCSYIVWDEAGPGAPINYTTTSIDCENEKVLDTKVETSFSALQHPSTIRVLNSGRVKIRRVLQYTPMNSRGYYQWISSGQNFCLDMKTVPATLEIKIDLLG